MSPAPCLGSKEVPGPQCPPIGRPVAAAGGDALAQPPLVSGASRARAGILRGTCAATQRLRCTGSSALPTGAVLAPWGRGRGVGGVCGKAGREPSRGPAWASGKRETWLK